jgi:hypothetical protein
VTVGVGVGTSTRTSMRPQRHLAAVPGMASAAEVHVPLMLLSQLTQVPMSTRPSLLMSVQGIVSCVRARYVSTPCSMSPHVSLAGSSVTYGPTPLVASYNPGPSNGPDR